jgi:hypothetical protein
VRCGIGSSDDHVDFESHQFSRKPREPLEFSFGIAILEADVLTLDVAELAKSLFERLVEDGGPRIRGSQNADAVRGGGLRFGRDRRGERTTSEVSRKRRRSIYSIL